MREERASGDGERALFDLGERERKGEMRMREKERQRERDLRESEKTMHTTIARSGIAGCSVRERRKLCVV
jgi:hypothetical protein